ANYSACDSVNDANANTYMLLALEECAALTLNQGFMLWRWWERGCARGVWCWFACCVHLVQYLLLTRLFRDWWGSVSRPDKCLKALLHICVTDEGLVCLCVCVCVCVYVCEHLSMCVCVSMCVV